MRIEESTILNGVKKVDIEVPGLYPEYFNLVFDIRSIPEEINMPGLAHFYEHAMFGGFGGMSEYESVIKTIDNIFHLNAATNIDFIHIDGYVRSSFDSALDIAMQMFKSPMLDTIERARSVILNEINEVSVFSTIVNKMWKSLLDGLGIDNENPLGNIDSVKKISYNDLMKFNEWAKNNDSIVFRTVHDLFDNKSYPIRSNEDANKQDPFDKIINIDYCNDLVLFCWNANFVNDYDLMYYELVFKEIVDYSNNEFGLYNRLRKKGYLYSMSSRSFVSGENCMFYVMAETPKGKGQYLLDEIKQWNNTDILVDDYINKMFVDIVRLNYNKEYFDIESKVDDLIKCYLNGFIIDDDRIMDREFSNIDVGGIKKMFSSLPTYSVVGI